ncbi:hypothetical protein [Paraburkholderia solisilvae]|uniref:Type I restriction enzyme R protein N-terminal domain-containing protein n=1 Tax=Paraburkholderia solisilvae TaxID=624376 RepID=A0A6J5EFA4_9BURK|nr:hypothetical protein [Paraburkholderia solisilvae]CAB3764354.1 hypothetical protein LMG29739_04336 [Paraburkholderia solisilvae]
MDRDTFLDHLTDALRAITTPRFYENERGFQGELLAELKKTIPADFLPDKAIIEQEYQKHFDSHGLKIRPDIIVHEPFDESRHGSRRDGNIAVIEIKRVASKKGATGDFGSLISMMDLLNYPLGIFINIASEATRADLVPVEWRDRIVCFAVSLRNAKTHVTRSDVK